MEKGRLGRYVTRRHAKHHNIDYTHWYTVSPGGQLVDAAFGSDPAQIRRRAERADVRARSRRSAAREESNPVRNGCEPDQQCRRACADAVGTGHLTIDRGLVPSASARVGVAAALAAVLSVPAPSRRRPTVGLRPRFRVRFYPREPVERPAIDGGGSRLGVGRIRPLAVGRTSISAGISSCTDPINRRALFDGEAMVVWRGAKTSRWQAVFFANDGDASPTPRSIRSARPTRRSRWSNPNVA